MAKNKMRKVKPPPRQAVLSKKSINKMIADGQIQQLGDRVNQLIDALVRLQQQTEVNRLGIVTLNKLHTDRDWPILLAKARQFMFGLVKVLEEKYPGILAEVYKCLEDTNASYEEIENVIGAFNAPIGYTIDEFKELFKESSFFRDVAEGHDESMVPVVADEEGTDEEAAAVFEAFMKSINDPNSKTFIEGVVDKTQTGADLIQEERPIICNPQTEDPAQSGTPIFATPHYEDPSIPDLGHDYQDSSVGRLTVLDAKTCSKCGEKFFRPLTTTDHNWNIRKKCTKCAKKKK